MVNWWEMVGDVGDDKNRTSFRKRKNREKLKGIPQNIDYIGDIFWVIVIDLDSIRFPTRGFSLHLSM